MLAETTHDSLQAADAQRHFSEVGRVRFPLRAEVPGRGRQQIQKYRFHRRALRQNSLDIGERGTVVVSER